MRTKKIIAALTAGVLTACMTPALTAFPEEGQKLRVMPLGDSITDGFTGDPVGGYRLTLWNMLAENGYTDGIDFVGPNWGGDGIDPNHAGYSGYAIADIPGQRSGLYNFSEWLMQEYPADVVLLQIGTNDILSSYELDTMGERLELLVDVVLNTLPEDGLLYLSTIPYMDADVTNYTDAYTVEEMDKAVDDYNAQVRELVNKKQAEGEPIAQADINAVLTKQDLLDGVHPSAAGYEKMGGYWYEKLTEYLENNSEDETETETEPETETETESETETETETETESETETETEPLPEKILGDINHDGETNLLDIVLLQKYLLGRESFSRDSFLSADMNQNGIVNIYDLIELKKIILFYNTAES